jgi:hypothetical protein
MALPNWFIHAAFLTVLAALIAFAYLGLELEFSGLWPTERG